MKSPNHYQILKVNSNATPAQIKQAYRRLVKIFHPDSNQNTADLEEIIKINAAYEVLGDPQKRSSYDQKFYSSSQPHYSTGQSVNRSQPSKNRGKDADAQLRQWLQQVYKPVNEIIQKIIKPLKQEIYELSADPFDDELLEAFQNYLEHSHNLLKQAQNLFRSAPNPALVASVASNLYYCLNQVSDGLEELELFTMNYDDDHLHTGHELFRIASHLRLEAQDSLKHFI
ncbi:MAG: J domain-containing protein [Microcoleaceae cyanobacterium]